MTGATPPRRVRTAAFIGRYVDDLGEVAVTTSTRIAVLPVMATGAVEGRVKKTGGVQIARSGSSSTARQASS